MDRIQGRKPGTRLIWASVVLLAGLAGVAFYVSYEAQYGFVYAVKHLSDTAAAEALIPDAGMLICALLALAMAVQGRPAKAARLLVVGFAALSAVMNYEAANSLSAHSVTVYVMPAVAFAVCVDLAVSVIRRFYYGIEETSPWTSAGRLVLAVLRAARITALYGLRFVLDPAGTGQGLRRAVLLAAPLPESTAPSAPPPVTGDQEPRMAAAVRAAWETGLAAARDDTERDMIRELVESGKALPAARELAREHPELAARKEATGRRAAGRVLTGARIILDSEHGHVNGSF